jgi:hypothetical protein
MARKKGKSSCVYPPEKWIPKMGWENMLIEDRPGILLFMKMVSESREKENQNREKSHNDKVECVAENDILWLPESMHADTANAKLDTILGILKDIHLMLFGKREIYGIENDQGNLKKMIREFIDADDVARSAEYDIREDSRKPTKEEEALMDLANAKRDKLREVILNERI